MSTTGQPEICPCGSGQTPYSCCVEMSPSPALQLEAQFSERLRQFGLRTRGPEWFRRAEQDLQLDSEDQELFESWYRQLVYYHYGAPTLFEAFLAERPSLSTEEKSLVWSLRQIRLSVFSIVEIRRGQSVLMEDLLFGGRAWVSEISLAEPDMLQAVLLARLAQVGEEILLLGMYVRPMAEWKARQIVREMHQPDWEPEFFCHPENAARLTRRFRQGLRELDDFSMPLQMTPEGEQLSRVCDRYPFSPAAFSSVRQALEAFPELYWENPRTANWIVGTSELGHLTLSENALLLECTSSGRADRLGESLRRIAELKKPRRTQQACPPDTQIQREYEEWASTWPDEALANLGGLTPLQAASRTDGRKLVETMVRDFEDYLATLPPTQSIPLHSLRRKLGLPARFEAHELLQDGHGFVP